MDRSLIAAALWAERRRMAALLGVMAAVFAGAVQNFVPRMGPTLAALVAGAMVLWLCTLLVPGARLRLAGRFPTDAALHRGERQMRAWVAVHMGIGWACAFPGLTPLAVPVGLAFVPFGRWLGRRAIDSSIETAMTAGTIALASPADAQRMVEASERRLAEPDLSTGDVADARINLAHALIARSELRDRRDGLPHAAEVLALVVFDPAVDPARAVDAAGELWQAARVRQRKHGDGTGLREALELWASAANRFADTPDGDPAMRPAIQAYVAAQRASYAMDGEAGDTRASQASRTEGVAAARAAVAGLPDGGWLRDDADALLSRLLTMEGASTAERDEAVAVARTWLARARRDEADARGVRRRLYAEQTEDAAVHLARLLLDRAERGLAAAPGTPALAFPGAVRDLDEAVALCHAAAEHSEPDPAAALVVATSLALLGRAPADDVARAMRRAVDAGLRASDQQGTEAAWTWAEWAIALERTPDAAEALWHVVTTVRTESSRQLTRTGREEVVRAIQGVAAEAGYWLTRAGRPAEAAVAVEYGRAVLFTGPTRSLDPELEAALARLGRLDLWQRWTAATSALDDIHRGQYAPSASESGAPVTPTSAFASPEHVAWSTYDDVLLDIREVLGEPVVASLPPYDELRRHIGDETVVYVGSARRGGYALVAGPGALPAVVDLPLLTHDDVERRLDDWFTVRARQPVRGPKTVDELLAWLEVAFAEPLVRSGAVPPPGPAGAAAPAEASLPEIVLVPVGLLGALPLHAALHGRLVVRHAPNARVASHARTIAGRTGARPTILAVNAPDVEGYPALPLTVAETRTIRSLYGAAVTVLDDATTDDVAARLTTSSVWHLACHGEADLDDPLASALVLKDGRLTLRQVLARRAGEHRLALLSSCDTNVPDLDLLDEVVSFPGGLLRAGVAGVVASQWPVEDAAAALLMVRVHHRLRDGWSPSRALADAQAWLRSATNAELGATAPDIVGAPAGMPAELRRAWAGRRPYRQAHHWAGFTMTGS